MWNKKHFFIIVKGLSITKNCLRPESAPLSNDSAINVEKPQSDFIQKKALAIF